VVLSLLVGDKDLEAVNDLGERDSLVLLPVLNGLSTLGEDNEVVVVALVVDSDLGSVSAHLGMCWGVVWVWVLWGIVGAVSSLWGIQLSWEICLDERKKEASRM
jgi:hypothetical protein